MKQCEYLLKIDETVLKELKGRALNECKSLDEFIVDKCIVGVPKLELMYGNGIDESIYLLYEGICIQIYKKSELKMALNNFWEISDGGF